MWPLPVALFRNPAPRDRLPPLYDRVYNNKIVWERLVRRFSKISQASKIESSDFEQIVNQCFVFTNMFSISYQLLYKTYQYLSEPPFE